MWVTGTLSNALDSTSSSRSTTSNTFNNNSILSLALTYLRRMQVRRIWFQKKAQPISDDTSRMKKNRNRWFRAQINALSRLCRRDRKISCQRQPKRVWGIMLIQKWNLRRLWNARIAWGRVLVPVIFARSPYCSINWRLRRRFKRTLIEGSTDLSLVVMMVLSFSGIFLTIWWLRRNSRCKTWPPQRENSIKQPRVVSPNPRRTTQAFRKFRCQFSAGFQSSNQSTSLCSLSMQIFRASSSVTSIFWPWTTTILFLFWDVKSISLFLKVSISSKKLEVLSQDSPREVHHVSSNHKWAR